MLLTAAQALPMDGLRPLTDPVLCDGERIVAACRRAEVMAGPEVGRA
jgi:hypothetical protein